MFLDNCSQPSGDFGLPKFLTKVSKVTRMCKTAVAIRISSFGSVCGTERTCVSYAVLA